MLTCFAALQNSASAAREFTDSPSDAQANTQEGACRVDGGSLAGAGAVLVKKHLKEKWSFSSTSGSRISGLRLSACSIKLKVSGWGCYWVETNPRSLI